MCGIVGYVGRKKASPILFQNLKKLEYRGYDSWGIATTDAAYESCGMDETEGAHIRVFKEKGSMDEGGDKFDPDELPGNIGIGHTRWATHGGVTRENAHPHLDCKGEIALVHNGIISNYAELKEELLKRGHTLKSETDSECLVHLIEEAKEDSLEEAVRSALGKVKGSYAIDVISSQEPDSLVCARSESPLVLGVGDGEFFVGSDITSFMRLTKKAVPLDDGEYAVIDSSGYVVKELATGKEVNKQTIEVEWDEESAEREGYPHFMLKEIMEQPRSITSTLNIYQEDIEKLAGMFQKSERVYILGAGTSLHAALVAEYWFAQLCSKVVIAMDSSEFKEKGVVDDSALVVGITQSGETYDTLAALRNAKEKGAATAAIVNVIGTTVTRLVDHVVLQGSGVEISVCATKTFTSQLIILLRTALTLAALGGKGDSSLRDTVETELLKCPDYVETVLELKDVIKEAVDEHVTAKNFIYLGKGINLPSALEGALKFKEITYLHSEGMSGGLLKHGTISLIDEDTQTICIVPGEGETRSKILNNVHEVKAREGFVIGVSVGTPLKECDVNIVVPACHELVSPIVIAPAYQMLAYYTAVKLGRNVDKPRALAKSVTVE